MELFLTSIQLQDRMEVFATVLAVAQLSPDGQDRPHCDVAYKLIPGIDS